MFSFLEVRAEPFIGYVSYAVEVSYRTQPLILDQMLTFAGATDFGNAEGNRFFVVIPNNHER